MTIYKFGDIVLIGFPHTDLQGISKRPAIVLYDSGDQDVLLARITTQEYTTEADYKIHEW
jgi:mRNA interferase MazF